MVLGGYSPGDFGGVSLTWGRGCIPANFRKIVRGCMLSNFQEICWAPSPTFMVPCGKFKGGAEGNPKNKVEVGLN